MQFTDYIYIYIKGTRTQEQLKILRSKESILGIILWKLQQCYMYNFDKDKLKFTNGCTFENIWKLQKI